MFKVFDSVNYSELYNKYAGLLNPESAVEGKILLFVTGNENKAKAVLQKLGDIKLDFHLFGQIKTDTDELQDLNEETLTKGKAEQASRNCIANPDFAEQIWSYFPNANIVNVYFMVEDTSFSYGQGYKYGGINIKQNIAYRTYVDRSSGTAIRKVRELKKHKYDPSKIQRDENNYPIYELDKGQGDDSDKGQEDDYPDRLAFFDNLNEIIAMSNMASRGYNKKALFTSSFAVAAVKFFKVDSKYCPLPFQTDYFCASKEFDLKSTKLFADDYAEVGTIWDFDAVIIVPGTEYSITEIDSGMVPNETNINTADIKPRSEAINKVFSFYAKKEDVVSV